MKLKNYYDEDILVSMEIPADWDIASTEQLPLVLLAPPQKEFRANMSFSVRPLNPPTPENLQSTIEQARKDRIATYDDFSLVSEERIMQDDFPGHLEYYRWNSDDTATPLTQLFALILTGPEALYGIHATTLQELEETYLPIFRGIIQSLRFTQR